MHKSQAVIIYYTLLRILKVTLLKDSALTMSIFHLMQVHISPYLIRIHFTKQNTDT